MAVKAESSSTIDTTTTMLAAVGPTGPTGPTGPAGSGTPGSPGISGYEIVRATKTAAPGVMNDFGGGSIDLSASCPAGKSILSGGASDTVEPRRTSAGSVLPYLRRSTQVDASTWTATLGWDSILDQQTITFTVTIACAFVS